MEMEMEMVIRAMELEMEMEMEMEMATHRTPGSAHGVRRLLLAMLPLRHPATSSTGSISPPK